MMKHQFTIVSSLDAASGNILKQGRVRGDVTVLRTDWPWTILSSHDFGERTLATPVIADGKIYFRTDKALDCFGSR